MKPILLIYKKSAYQLYVLEKKDPSFLSLKKKNHPSYLKLFQSHTEHATSLAYIVEFFKKNKIPFKMIHRSKPFNELDFSFILTVGGDGTFLEASRSVKRKMILGINSAPHFSVGRFCSFHAHEFINQFEKLYANQLEKTSLYRLGVKVSGTPSTHVLNDILITNQNPAATSRYSITINGISEDQTSSGIWISTPQGSTAAISSAGGKKINIDEFKFQYVVREPYMYQKKYTLLKGVMDGMISLTVESKMRNGCIYLDGSHEKIPFPSGNKVQVRLKKQTLDVWGTLGSKSISY